MSGLTKTILGLAVLVLAAGFGYAVGSKKLLVDGGLDKEAVTTDPARLDRLEKQLNQLTRQIDDSGASETADRTLSSRINELDRHLKEIGETVAELKRARDADRLNESQTTSPTNKDLFGFQNKKQQIREYKKQIEETFASEPRDQLWANSMSVEIEQTFQEPELSAGQLANVDCRSTMCRAEVIHSTNEPDELFKFENQMLIKLAEEFPTTHTRQVDGVDGPRTIVYFVREGKQLPRLDADTSGGDPSQ